MIVDLPNTSTSKVSKELVRLREDVGAMALSRVLTLVMVVADEHAEDAISVASAASHQHPSRIVAVVIGDGRGLSRLDAQIRVGGDAGASEVVVLRLFGPLTKHARSVVIPLLLPDSPVVAWWPNRPPADASEDPVGAMAQRRITDITRTGAAPRSALRKLAETYEAGDTDLAWARITLWRGLLAAALDRPPYQEVESAVVVGAEDSPSVDLLAGWLAARLKCPVSTVRSRSRTGVISVRLTRASGDIDLVRPQDGETAILSAPDQPERSIALAHRSDVECLADELSRLDADEVYEEALTRGLGEVTARRMTMTAAIDKGIAPSVSESRQVARRLAEEAATALTSTMVTAEKR
ncbi:glucose-6-phosphate dehydrogenase assembly protein OpcA [Janibacter sp. GXQ6167]|uniref:glucose-6-phosphate dehydrogenase assembly protein OpcA n=1 Tax=Janibacter sp. GXQ6167 TaxID=3240791 RepID=UPI0035249334